MEQFPHLKFIQKIVGKPRLFGGGGVSEITEKNKENRQGHSNFLNDKTTNIKKEWSTFILERDTDQLAPLDKEIIPIFLKINPQLINYDFDLQSLGIEIISEEDEGFIIGASLDGLVSLEEKISGFKEEIHGTGIIADLWEIIEGNREAWKPQYILSKELFEKWSQILDDQTYKVEVSIAFDKPLAKEPDPEKQGGEKRLQKFRQQQEERDNQLLERENNFETFLKNYGKLNSGYVHLEDSFGCEIEISGKGLKDLVVNYPFVFEVCEIEEVSGTECDDIFDLENDVEVLAPDEDSIEIGVIDSGIMENNKFLSPAINFAKSKSYIPGDNSVADYVSNGGHGTKVAGAILYPNGISAIPNLYKLPCFIRNLRVLDNNNGLVHKFPAELMKIIVDENKDCSIYNLSINSSVPYRNKHMSLWAATLDSLIHNKDILFIVSTGNIRKNDIKYYLNNGETYPHYLTNNYCRIANPAQSSFALSVGSINHSDFNDQSWESLGSAGDISAFSRIGLGIWEKIKPDVVEFGGGLVVSKDGRNAIVENEHTAPELIRSTYHGGNVIGKDSTGTSFAAPKVTNIVAQLKNIYPNEGINLLRSLVVQGARLPNGHFTNPTIESIRFFGYGLPSLERVTKNSEQRVTFYNTGTIQAEEGHIYSLRIPDQLRVQANEYDILIEVCLAYTANVRRTRQKTKSYLSTWLDWTTSKIDEPFEEFKDFALKEIEEATTNYDNERRKQYEIFPWKIGERDNWGEIDEIKRNNSTIQKDWAIIKSYQLPKEIGFAVRGHKGWDKSKEQVPYALTVSIEVLNANVPIYEAIKIENEIESRV